MKTPKIAPSILASDFSKIGEEVRAMTQAGADWIHVDVMDGHFVPNISIGPQMVKAIRPHTNLPLDVHLMISPVDPYVAEFAQAGADIITVHPEAGPHIHRTVQLIKGLGKKAGLALNPGSPVSLIETMVAEVDLILVMTVNPGFGGQSFIDSQRAKIAAVRALIDRLGRPIELEVDGGINAQTASIAVGDGADVLVAGTAAFHGGPASYADNIKRLRGG
jgi:ribulose-phosphate 3-epimerase